MEKSARFSANVRAHSEGAWMSQASGNNGANGSGAAGDLELPLVALPTSHPCHECGKCCHYIAVEIDRPTAFRDYENIYWYLTHRNVCVYIDWEGDWFIEFATPCDHLTEAKTCGVYEERPKICSEFSWDECEETTQERAWKYRLTSFPAPELDHIHFNTVLDTTRSEEVLGVDPEYSLHEILEPFKADETRTEM